MVSWSSLFRLCEIAEEPLNNYNFCLPAVRKSLYQNITREYNLGRTTFKTRGIFGPTVDLKHEIKCAVFQTGISPDFRHSPWNYIYIYTHTHTHTHTLVLGFLHGVRGECAKNILRSNSRPVKMGATAVSETSTVHSPRTPCKNPKTKKQRHRHCFTPRRVFNINASENVKSTLRK